MYPKKKRGRPALYQQNGATPTPPADGWQSESTNTPHGREAIALIKSGAICSTDKPHLIWNRYAALQVIEPKIFGRFLRNCFRRADAPDISDAQADFSDAPTDISDSPVTFVEPSDMSRSSSRRLRSSDPEEDGGTNYSLCNSLDYPKTVDAPPNNEDGSRVLRSISEISGKDQSVAMDSDFIPIGERGYLTMLGMQSGTNESDYSFSRRKDNTAMGDITWRRNKLLRDEVSFKNALISGTNPMINGDTVKVHPDDPTVGAVTSHLIRRNGGTVSETDARDRGNGKNIQTLHYPEPIKSMVAPWSLTLEDGTKYEMSGMDMLGPNTLAIFVERLSFGQETVNKVKRQTPPRYPRGGHYHGPGGGFPGPGGGFPHGGGHYRGFYQNHPGGGFPHGAPPPGGFGWGAGAPAPAAAAQPSGATSGFAPGAPSPFGQQPRGAPAPAAPSFAFGAAAQPGGATNGFPPGAPSQFGQPPPQQQAGGGCTSGQFPHHFAPGHGPNSGHYAHPAAAPDSVPSHQRGDPDQGGAGGPEADSWSLPSMSIHGGVNSADYTYHPSNYTSSHRGGEIPSVQEEANEYAARSAQYNNNYASVPGEISLPTHQAQYQFPDRTPLSTKRDFGKRSRTDMSVAGVSIATDEL
mmetsp:Transcript_22068/g.50471  ORF Transcript_22068/g.50471 Transcript_22068/m.50471 type:complete len:636 (-) Transcript_22068:178-2085(-)